jgi:hypothetical protein
LLASKLSLEDFGGSVFLSVPGRWPEMRIPGIAGHRGALSYAVARAIEGSLVAKTDGTITVGALLSFVGQLVSKLSDQRQGVVAVCARDRDIDSDVLFRVDHR